MPTLSELEREARATVDGVANNPEGRLALRQTFYRAYGFSGDLDGIDEYGYGSSELAFLKWEITRGVLDPTKMVRGGSPWWRGVNSDFMYFSELGALAHQAGIEADRLSNPCRAWFDYINDPNEQSWYTAHNTSIVEGYENRRAEAEAERRYEQIFVNEVLYRLLYAQGMVEGVELGAIGRLLANPALPSVDIMVSLPDFYPRHYPLTRKGIRAVLHEGHSIEEWATKLLDLVLISPHLQGLYEHARTWLRFPQIMTYITRGEPTYPSGKSFSIRRHGFVRILRLVSRIFHGLRES